jgi:hypothetical protein
MIQPWSNNPRYWQYKNQPVMLLGGSREDNLFQIPELEQHLDLLRSVGGNYIRCTMSSRDEGDVWPHYLDEITGQYDLERFNPEYWRRFDNLLRWTADKGIFVQIEVWDRFDFSRDPWQVNSFNPKNNLTYTAEATGLEAVYPEHPGRNLQPFFYSVPALNNHTLLLKYQQAFVDEMLSHSLPYDHVLYCMDNETNGAEEWGAHWAGYIRQRSQAAGKRVHLTEMWDQWDITDAMHNRTFDHSELYDFVDVSQNNHIRGEAHWTNMQARRAYLADQPRPMNMVKIYGATGNVFKHTDDDGIARFWRGLLGGMASIRFHRPPSGLGLGSLAQANLKSARLLLDEVNIWDCLPDSDHRLLSERSEDGVYLTAQSNEKYILYFPRAGSVRLQAAGSFSLRWLDILASQWAAEHTLQAADSLVLETPGAGHWLALVKRL